jgi:hypothetical protein
MITSDYEKKMFAEFSTHQILIDSMIDKMPPEFWQTPKKIWEPCCGKGGFVLSLFDKLFIGLETYCSNVQERCRIILEECIYFSDINLNNVKIVEELVMEKAFGLVQLAHTYTLLSSTINILTTYPYPLQFFDFIIGNPPFNSSLLNKNIIWPEIVSNSLNNWIKEDGYLLFISPPGWRKPDKERSKYHNLFSLLTQQNWLKYLEMHTKKDGRTMFACNTFFDWYLIQKREPEKSISLIKDTEGKEHTICLKDMKWLPSSHIQEIISITNYDSIGHKGGSACAYNAPILYSRCAYGTDKKHMSATYSADIYKYSCIHSILKNGQIRYYYSSRNDRGHFNVSKVIFAETGIHHPILDWEGKYGMTHGAMALQIDSLEEGASICTAITSPKFQEIISACICSSYRIDWIIFKEFRKDFWKKFIQT